MASRSLPGGEGYSQAMTGGAADAGTKITRLAAGGTVDADRYLSDLGLDARRDERRILLNMASTADGRATLGGRSAAIGGPADRALFHALRGRADAVLVGAGTVRAERYGPLVPAAGARERRVARGLAPQPIACIVSGSADLDPSLPLLADGDSHVVVLTGGGGEVPPCAAQVDYVRAPAAQGGVDIAAALGEVERRYDARVVLCEGGPHLAAELLAAGLLGELWLTIGARLAGDDPAAEARRILAGRRFGEPIELDLLDVGRGESDLFLRYGVRSPAVSRATTD